MVLNSTVSIVFSLWRVKERLFEDASDITFYYYYYF